MISGTEIHPSRLSLGNRVSLITGVQYRYEGVVAAINSIEGTLTLQNVRFWGTENRVPGNAITASGESKALTVGYMYDAITFWMSNIVQLWLLDDVKSERNDVGDKGVVKAGVPVDASRGRSRRQRGWWQPAGDPPRPMRSSPTNGMASVNGMVAPMGRYNNSTAPQPIISQPRMLVSYPRRGRNSTVLPRQASYVPVVPVVPGPSGLRRSGYGSSMRGGPFRMMHTPIPNGVPTGSMGGGPRGIGRKPIAHRRMNGSVDDRQYHAGGGINTTGGVFVYLPPEMAAAYQSRGINLVPARPTMGRRRTVERRGTPRASSSIEPEIDCSTPYDFETANAELEAELAKITINPDGIPTVNSATAGNATVGTTSTGDGVNTEANSTTSTTAARSPTSSTTAVCQAAVSGNGASGDSSTGAVTSTVNTSGINGTTGDGAPTGLEGNGPLAKGEYYVRDKCFFDQISRSESGPRGPFGGVGRGLYQPGSYGHSLTNGAVGLGVLPGGSAAAAARRERQLNMETFGPMAARLPFVSRRRPTGSVPREFLVSASA
ncbi:hypothetical protein FGIG_06524 [Fasciola gigantica]|uniref:Lsm14-like N-terminal domain-containing protein n=1 Tax=Fasciola gigantica TaxID=46835 RepID=A0A504Y842_FASGI|nr:hypothetical protein FGIG_06524 [Fasciola gigantica]